MLINVVMIPAITLAIVFLVFVEFEWIIGPIMSRFFRKLDDFRWSVISRFLDTISH